MGELLKHIRSPADLKALSLAQLRDLAGEIREELRYIASTRAAHFASNLGVVELCLALHIVFDFSQDRLIWDTGHQTYPHKLVTGRADRIHSIRMKGGVAGFPRPEESPYDLFATGHAATSVSLGLGMKIGDHLQGRTNQTVVVIGDGSLASGVPFEAMNHAGGVQRDLLIVLNDNEMSISPRVGSLARYLDTARLTDTYAELKREVHRVLSKLPLGDRVQKVLEIVKDGLKASMIGGMFFEYLGLRYIGPVDGHDIEELTQRLHALKGKPGPILLHVLTEKGHGFAPALADPVTYHAPPPLTTVEGKVVPLAKPGPPSFTQHMAEAIERAAQRDPRVVAITAAMTEGTRLNRFQQRFPDRFFDVGICESHAVAFAAGLAKSGMRPVVAIYSTFLQRAFDQLFQEVALQNLPVTLCMDRAGLAGPDGPTHHGVFDVAYLRPLPNVVLMGPGDAHDVEPMLQFALAHPGPCAIRYPKAEAPVVDRQPAPIACGRAEVLHWGRDGSFVAYGAPLAAALEARSILAGTGIDMGVINARFAKPLDHDVVIEAFRRAPLVVTVEEGCLAGGFGSAVQASARQHQLDTRHLCCLGVGDHFVEHASRGELLEMLGLDAAGLVRAVRDVAVAQGWVADAADHRRQVG